MKNNKNKNKIGPKRAFLTGMILALPAFGAAEAAQWEYGAVIDVGVIRSDNIFLEPSGMEESEIVYMLTPQFYLRTTGDRIAADLRYRPEAYLYDTNSTADNVFHVVDMTVTTTLVRDKFFLLLNGTNFQSIVTPDGRIPTSNIPITANRVDSRILEARPYWQQRVGSADLYLEAGVSDIDYDDPTIQGSQVVRGSFKLDNIARQQGLAWGVGYNHVRAEYDLGAEWEHQRAEANLGYWVTGTVRLFAAGGAETDVTRIDDPNLDESFWEAGIQYKPNARLDMEFAAGERYYGTSIRANLAWTMRRGTTRLTYTEGPGTGSQLPSGRRPLVDVDDLDSLLDQPGRSDRFLQRRLNWTTMIELAKSNLNLRLYREIREERETLSSTELLDDQENSGMSLRWSWRAGARTTFGVGANLARIDVQQRNSDVRSLSADVGYRLGQHTNVRLEYINSRQDGRDSNQFDHTEDQVRLLLRAEF